MSDVAVLVQKKHGHRAEYARVFSQVLREHGMREISKGLGIGTAVIAVPVVSLMIEEHSWKFFVVALLRAILKRRTVGLLFRPIQVISRASFRLRLKWLALRVLRQFSSVAVITIMPLDVDARLSSIARSGIVDFQLWDQEALPLPAVDFHRELVLRAGGRSIVAFLGGITNDKGFEFFVDVCCGMVREGQEAVFVAAGEVHQACVMDARRFVEAGGLLYDRYLMPEELMATYEAAGAVWACYSPSYDQASGILGRAVQLGVPAVVRAGSAMDKLSRVAPFDVIAIRWGDVAHAVMELAHLPNTSPLSPATAAMWRANSVRTLIKHISSSDISGS